MLQLLWIETVLKLAGGLALMTTPMLLIKALGLPHSGGSFWPRLVGALLIGLAGATFLQGVKPELHALGLAGCIVINLTVAAVIGAVATLGGGATTRRGSALLWTLVVVLVVLSLFEIAHA